MNQSHPHSQTGVISWFARNSVAANLLMMLIFILGIGSAFLIQKRMFPEFDIDSVEVTVVYPGASPVDIEKGINVKIEEAISNISGIKQIRSFAADSLSTVYVDVESGFNVDLIVDEVKLEVEAITGLPEDAEKPLVRRAEFENPVMWLSIYGKTDQLTLYQLAGNLQDDLLTLPEVQKVSIPGGTDRIISIEVSEDVLREHGLTFSEIATAIRGSSVDLSAGSIETQGGNIAVRTKGQAWHPVDFLSIVVRDNPDGQQLLIRDIASVNEQFEYDESYSRFNGLQSVNISVSSEGDGSDIKTSEAVKKWVENIRPQLPEGVSIEYWGDSSFYLQGRLNMMLENMLIGALLVFLLLSLFLRVKVAFWVMLGLPVSFLGAIILMPLGPLPVTINIISLFAFILVLGVVVDDAIIVGESVYSEIGEKGHSIENVIAGVKKVVVPASFGVFTTIAAFAPILTVGGQTAPFFESIAVVVIWCLLFSLIESKLILPAHLAHMHVKDYGSHKPWLTRVQDSFSERLNQFVQYYYLPTLKLALRARYITLSLFLALMMIVIGILKSDLIKFVLFPEVPSDFIEVEIEMNIGATSDQRNSVLNTTINKLYDIDKEYLNSLSKEKTDGEEGLGIIKHTLLYDTGNTSGKMVIEMTKAENRTLDAYQIVDMWREKVGSLPGVKRLEFRAGTNVGGTKPVNFRISSDNPEQLTGFVQDLTTQMKTLPALKDVVNNYKPGVDEIVLTLLPSAKALDLDLVSIGRQVRQGFYGEEVERFQRGNDEIRVLLRYPESERKALGDLESMRIRTSNGVEVPLREVAGFERREGMSTITRLDGSRSLSVSADVKTEISEPTRAIQKIEEELMPPLLDRYPDVEYRLGGASLEQEETIQNMIRALLIALFLIYALIAIPLKSYKQPLIIMSIIPFGLIGAVIGHLALGLNLSMLSIYGLIALSGVLVNDSLILVDFVNRHRMDLGDLTQSVISACRARFRAILLTSLTTFFGLIPILMEKSLQAQFVIPMATSLGFGILFATAITLFLIPTLYLVLDDLGQAKHWYQKRNVRTKIFTEFFILCIGVGVLIGVWFWVKA